MVKKQRSKFSESVNAYMEEGIVRRELSDNFCYYNDNYDKIEGKKGFCFAFVSSMECSEGSTSCTWP